MFKENAKRPEGKYGGDIIYEGYSPDFHCYRCTYDWRIDGNECGFWDVGLSNCSYGKERRKQIRIKGGGLSKLWGLQEGIY